jgi:hypothetical protein
MGQVLALYVVHHQVLRIMRGAKMVPRLGQVGVLWLSHYPDFVLELAG